MKHSAQNVLKNTVHVSFKFINVLIKVLYVLKAETHKSLFWHLYLKTRGLMKMIYNQCIIKCMDNKKLCTLGTKYPRKFYKNS